MPITKVIAKKDLLPIFKIGDSLTIIPILYEKDTLIRKEIYGIFKDNKFIYIASKIDFLKNLNGKRMDIRKISEDLYAPKGSYKDSVIEIEDGRRFPSSLVRHYEDYFEKVNL